MLTFSLRGLRCLFYLILPSETADGGSPAVDAYGEATPFCIVFLFLEVVYSRLAAGQFRHHELCDSIAGLNSHLLALVLRSLLFLSLLSETTIYETVASKYSLFQLSPASLECFLIGVLGVDFFKYWAHRVEHSVTLCWAFHRVHHSAERFTLFATFRNSLLDIILTTAFVWPLALVIPTSSVVIHLGLNDLYTFWTHTAQVPKLGPLEWILVTPSAHRVHHGRNAYCIDKNYGHVFIVFDKLFGSFAAELDSEPVMYGTVEPVKSHNVVLLQYDLMLIWSRWTQFDRLKDRVKGLILAPGWQPSIHADILQLLSPSPFFPEPKAGNAIMESNNDNSDKPEKEPEVRYEVNHSWTLKIYIVLQTILAALLVFHVTGQTSLIGSAPEPVLVFSQRLFCVFLIFCNGCVMDDQLSIAIWLEPVKAVVACLLFGVTIRVLAVISIAWWALAMVKRKQRSLVGCLSSAGLEHMEYY